MPIRKFKRGKRWHLDGTVTVGERSKSIRESTGLIDEGQAEIYRAKRESRIIAELLHGEQEVVTFEEAWISYGESGGSARFMAPLLDKFGQRVLKTITQSDLDKAAAELYPTSTPETRNRQCYTPFIAVWNHAVKNGWAAIKLWQRPRKPKGTNVVRLSSARSGQKPVDYERTAKFVAAMSPAPAMLMTALFYTGLRPIEAFALQAEDVDLAGRWLVVRSSKTGEPRGVPVHSFLASWLAPLVERGGCVFRTPRGEPYGAVQDGGGGLKSAINGARRRSGIDDVSPYTGRHTVSTGLVIAGVHPHIKDQILGHAADSMSRHYTNVPQRPLIEAIDLLPVPALWRSFEWTKAPQEWWGKLAEGTGRRIDLERGTA